MAHESQVSFYRKVIQSFPKLDCHGVFGQWALLKWGCH